MSDGVISFNKICGRLCVEMTGHLASPLSIGSGEEEHSDSDVVFGRPGNPTYRVVLWRGRCLNIRRS